MNNSVNKNNNTTATETTSMLNVSNLWEHITNWWEELNDPEKERQRHPDPRQLLKRNSVLFAIMVFIFGVAFMSAVDAKGIFLEELRYCFVAAVALLSMQELRRYRTAILNGEEERQRFLLRLEGRLVRGFTRLLGLGATVVVSAHLLQYVPNLSEVSPALVEISDLVVDSFNHLLEQCMALVR